MTVPAAGMLPGMLLMMGTVYVRIIGQSSGQKSRRRFIRFSRCTTVNLNTCLRQRLLRTAADTAADQHVRMVFF